MSRGNILLELALKGQTDHIYARRNRPKEPKTPELEDCSTNPPECTLYPTGTALEEDMDEEPKTPELEDCSTNPPECTLYPTGTALEEDMDEEPKTPELEDCSTNPPECTLYPTGTALEEDMDEEQQIHTKPELQEFELVPSGHENVFILKPIEEDFNQHSTWEGGSDLLSNVNITDESFYLEQVISEGITMEDENLNMEYTLDVQGELNNEFSTDIPDVEDSVNKEMLQSYDTVENESLHEFSMDEPDLQNSVNDKMQRGTDNIENELLCCNPHDFGTNGPTQEVAEVNDLEQEPVNESSVSGEMPSKRIRSKKPMKHLWVSEKNKEKRMKGEDYFGRRKNDSGKNVFDVKRPEKKQKTRCPCKAKSKSVFKCYKLTEERRREIFKDFWKLDWKERHILVKQLVDRRLVTNRRVNSMDFRRKGSLYYHLNIKENEERFRVCKQMFLNTLALGEWAVSNWISNSPGSQEGEQLEDEVGTEQDRENNDEVEKTIPTRNKAQKDKSIRMKVVREFFDMLPKLESHYCRKNTKKMYLEPNWQSKAELYRHYKTYCESEGKGSYIASDCLFSSVFDELNLGLFSPKKDQCDVCCAYKQGNLKKEDYDEHIRKKDLARSEKDYDKAKSGDRTAVFTMDMQAVLLSPSLKASALYYKSKLKVHNYTIYNLKTSDAVCYLWNESEGGLDADEFSSIITHFLLNEVDRSQTDCVILYSDGCTYQNRNSTLANALLFTSNQTGLTITQKFLEKGHTQMECDSIHSVIERKLRNREIYSPAGYVEVCRTARTKPAPYKVHYLDHTFFRKFNDLKFVCSIRPGKKKGDPVVTNLRAIEYKPEGTILVKLNFSDEFSDLPNRIKPPPYEVCLKPLHRKRIPIKSRLFMDLQELKIVLPKDVHGFYDSLLHYKKETKVICGEDNSCCTHVSQVYLKPEISS